MFSSDGCVEGPTFCPCPPGSAHLAWRVVGPPGTGPGPESKLSALGRGGQLDSWATADVHVSFPTHESRHVTSRERRRGLWLRVGGQTGRSVFNPWTEFIFVLKSVCQPLFFVYDIVLTSVKLANWRSLPEF